MNSESLGHVCRKLNKEYGYVHAVFVGAFVMSTLSIYFFIIFPILKLIFGDEVAGYLIFALPCMAMLAGFTFEFQHYEKLLRFLYKRSKIWLTAGTLCSLVLVRIKSLIISPLTPNNHGN